MPVYPQWKSVKERLAQGDALNRVYAFSNICHPPYKLVSVENDEATIEMYESSESEERRQVTVPLKSIINDLETLADEGDFPELIEKKKTLSPTQPLNR